MSERYYAAYGSNLNVDKMARRCPDAAVIGTTMIEGYELLYKEGWSGSYLTIEPKADSQVPAAIWQISQEDERALDRYEGYPGLYYKKEMTLPVKRMNQQAEEMSVFVYIMDEKRPFGFPSQKYVRECEEGYQAFGFDPKYLQEALERSIFSDDW